MGEATNEEVMKVTLHLTIKMTLEKLKQWIKIHLTEDIFYDEFKNKEFKKRLFEKSLLNSASFNNSMMNNTNNDLDQTKIFNNTMNLSIIQNNRSFCNKDNTDNILTSDLFNEIKVCFFKNNRIHL